jgi:hypothetical protein
MSFGLFYVYRINEPQDPKPLFVESLLRAPGEFFHIETELIVFYESSHMGSRPLYAATLSDLQYVARDDTSDEGPGFKVDGRLPNDKRLELWAGEAQTFFYEQRFAVFYEHPDRSGKQSLAVRCSDVREIEWLPNKESTA